MRFLTLASGSDGNSTLISSKNCNILIDCGISVKRLLESLETLGLSIYDIDAVFLTHEHTDHIKCLKRLMSVYNIKVFTSNGTAAALYNATKDEYFNYAGKELISFINADCVYTLKDIDVIPFHIYHDAAEPFGYRVRCESKTVCVLTDCGHADDYIVEHLKECDSLLIEANHDRGMLANGPYPMILKRRIMSLNGHMSNASCGNLLSEICTDRLKNVLLGHLSKTNNTEQMALETVTKILIDSCGADVLNDTHIYAAPHNTLSKIIEL